MIFRKYLKAHNQVIRKFAKKFQVKIYAHSFNGNHVHLIIRLYHRDSYSKFIRAISSRISSIAGFKKAFTLRPYTRFIKWGRDLKRALSYIDINRLQADGLSKDIARLLSGLLSEGPPGSG